MNTRYKKYKKIFCNNCGRYGHVYAKCRDPITSSGIINFKIDHCDDSVIDTFKKKYESYATNGRGNRNIIIPLDDKIRCADKMCIDKTKYLKKFCDLKNHIKFLMIRRKNTLGYIEFIRGRYNPIDADSVINLFEQMVISEINMIKNNDLEYLWDKLWKSNSKNKAYEFEFKQSKIKFDKLKSNELKYNLDFYIENVNFKYDTPEWGFPKGRRNFYEKNIDCAIREFNEESGYSMEDYKIMKRLHSLNEIFVGTNGVKYKHVYYIGIFISDKQAKINVEKPSQYDEIGDIGWFTFNDALDLIRPHHRQRKKILTELFMFLLNELIEIDNRGGENMLV